VEEEGVFLSLTLSVRKRYYVSESSMFSLV
jgi:hypothetical protein